MSVESFSRSAASPDRPPPAIYPFIYAIRLYRMTLSPLITALFGGGCRFYPSCSHYAEDAIRKYGVFRGSTMALKRLLRCHPWHDGGFDPVR